MRFNPIVRSSLTFLQGFCEVVGPRRLFSENCENSRKSGKSPTVTTQEGEENDGKQWQKKYLHCNLFWRDWPVKVEPLCWRTCKKNLNKSDLCIQSIQVSKGLKPASITNAGSQNLNVLKGLLIYSIVLWKDINEDICTLYVDVEKI